MTGGIALLAGLFATVSADAASPRPPNIVVMLSGDQGYADISFNPHHPKEVSTPHLDALARESVFFSQGYLTMRLTGETVAFIQKYKAAR